MKTKLASSMVTVGFLFGNFISGIYYQRLKFEVLGHSSGTGVVPGPWLIVPFLSLGVIPIGLVLGAILYVIRASTKRDASPFVWIMVGYIVCSIWFHVLVTATIVADADFWATD